MSAENRETRPILSSNNRNTSYQSFETQGSHYTDATSTAAIREDVSQRTQDETCDFCIRCERICLQLTSYVWGPSQVNISRAVALICLTFLLWGILYTIVGSSAGPEGQLFKICVLGVAAYFAGRLTSLFKLPSLLGMLLMGMLLQNVGFMNLSGGYLTFAADLRKAALVIILIKAGLGLDPVALMKLKGMVFRLAVLPSIAEVIASTLIANYLLELPWLWACLLGSVMAAVSPAVVVPLVYDLQDRGYGKSKGIATLVIAAASIDDIISISAFGVVLSLIFSQDALSTTIIKGPVGLLAGLVFGVSWGALLWYVPERNDRFAVTLRCILLGGGGVFSLFGSEALGYDSAGPLGCIVAAFVACHGWRKEGWEDETNPVSDCFAVLWILFQPILFGLIGAEIDKDFFDSEMLKLGAGCLVVSLITRIVVTVLTAAGGNLNWKEKIFVALAWFPKATVQAAIGPIALDIARRIESEEDEVYGRKVLIVAVIAILITAPVGATLIGMLGPKLLHRESIFSVGSHMLPSLQGNSKKDTTTYFNIETG